MEHDILRKPSDLSTENEYSRDMTSEKLPHSSPHGMENEAYISDDHNKYGQDAKTGVSGETARNGVAAPSPGNIVSGQESGIFFITEQSIGGNRGQFSISIDRRDIYGEQYLPSDINVKSSHENIELSELVKAKNTQHKETLNNNNHDSFQQNINHHDTEIICHESIELDPRNPELDPRTHDLANSHQETTAQDAELIESDKTNAFCEWHQRKAIAITVAICITVIFTALIVTLIVFIVDRTSK